MARYQNLLICMALITPTEGSAQQVRITVPGILGQLRESPRPQHLSPALADRMDVQLPTDDPELPGFEYRNDRHGRRTYLSYGCLYSQDPLFSTSCMQMEVQKHDQIVADRAHRDQERAEAKRQEEIEKAEQERARQRQLAEQQAWENSPAGQAQARQERILSLENTIASLKGHIVYLRGLIAQQRRAAAISGYVDKSVMYGAGLAITRDQDKIAQAYAAYRQAGGRRDLGAIGARTAKRSDSVFAY